MQEVKFRECGDCTECCSGHLIGDAHGNKFGNGRKCIFLVQEKCTIYTTRPETCHKYQCAWSQSLFDEDMRPDKFGLMVSVEVKTGERLLRVIETKKDVPYEAYQRIDEWAKKLNVKWIGVKHYEHNIYNQRRCGTCDSEHSCS
jgi:Fe-S-cluster containining protein